MCSLIWAMAMAEVYLFPELTGEDHLTPFPRAPPPSPEMQPRSHSHVFEIPASKFEGIGLDLRRNTFPLDEEDESPFSACHLSAMGYGNRENVSNLRESDDDASFPGSPQKRVCCSPCTLPSDFMTTSFPSSNPDSLISSGFGSYQAPPLHDTILEEETSSLAGFRNRGGSGSHSNSPLYFDSRPAHDQQTSPQLITRGIGTTTLGSAAPGLSSDGTLLSRSFDLHNMHPHLPQSFETTQLPEVRPTRSRTLDSTSPSHDLALAHIQTTLDASYGREDSNQRRRKVSIKRKNPDENDADPSLQFSFEYSYSSTGSSGESDWVMVDCNVEPSWPMEKKACCVGDDPSSLSIPHFSAASLMGAPPLQGTSFPSFSDGRDGKGMFVPPHLLRQNPLDLHASENTGISPFSNVTPLYFAGQQEVGSVGERVDTPTNGHRAPQSLESETMMDCGGRLDSSDFMDCEQYTSLTSAMDSNTDEALFGSSRGMASSGHVIKTVAGQLSAESQPPMLLGEQEAPPGGSLVARPRPRGPSSASLALRRSCVEEYLNKPVHSAHGGGQRVGVSNTSEMNSDLDTRVNISKSF